MTGLCVCVFCVVSCLVEAVCVASRIDHGIFVFFAFFRGFWSGVMDFGGFLLGSEGGSGVSVDFRAGCVSLANAKTFCGVLWCLAAFRGFGGF